MGRCSLRYASAILRPLASDIPAASSRKAPDGCASLLRAFSSVSRANQGFLSPKINPCRQPFYYFGGNGVEKSWLPYGGVRGEATVSAQETVATDAEANQSASENSTAEASAAPAVSSAPTSNETAEASKPAPELVGEKFTYQAEVSRLLDLIVHSLYSHKEVFLRELVSNASDALDKLRFLSVSNSTILDGESELSIKIRTDKEEGVLIITDTGIGMTKDELISSLGTIARSGTANFAKALKESKDGGIAGESNLIGKFGVGFYSAFLVAEKVAVSTKSPKSDKQYVWEADADCGAFVIREETDPRYLVPRGTNIILYLKPEAENEYLDPTRIMNLVKNYSQFISFPIYVGTERTREVEVKDEAAAPEEGKVEEPKVDEPVVTEEAKAGGEAEAVPELVKVEEKKEPTKKITEKYHTYEMVNDAKPIWLRNPKEVAKDEYYDFFKRTYNEHLEPMGYTHFFTEGEVEFKSLLYIPGMAPFGANDEGNIKLYVKRVFISDAFSGALFPKYLCFMKGIVDSNDLPLNVSREVLQESRIVNLMKKRLVKKSFDLFDAMAKSSDPEDYRKFWRNFGKYLKFGISEDERNQKRIAPLLRFYSSKHQEDMTSLTDYVDNMKPGQKAIYYLSSESVKSARNAPCLEQLYKRDYEVLFMVEHLDEVTAQHLKRFEGKELVDVSKEEFHLADDDGPSQRELAKEYGLLCDWMKKKLGDKIAKVEVSKRLSSSPCVLVSGKHGWSANMERIMRTHNLGETPGLREYMWSTRILEINPNHPVIRNLDGLRRSGKPGTDNIVQLLYQTSLMSSGFTLEDPAGYGTRIYDMMVSTLSTQGAVITGQSQDAPLKASVGLSAPAPSESEAEILEIDDKPESASA